MGDERRVCVGRKINIMDWPRVVSHVWSSSINQWVSGMTPNGSVGEELRNAAVLLLGHYD